MKILFLFLIYATCNAIPQVDLPFGKIEGYFDQAINGRAFFSFEGVPYARPPVGKYRFKESIPPKPWKGVWKADTTVECLQYSHFPKSEKDPVEGSEDCLYLNIYTPNLKGNQDVFVFIHGGAFIFGAGHIYKPHILLDRDVVFVTLNYRLGPLGFLSTEDDVVPGNNGLKDQILALKWIKENIKYFGGNPNSITISGMSAGGASVHFHTLNAKSKGLFNGGISMSGCMLNPWVIMEKPLERTKQLANIVGCDSENTATIIDCLRTRPAKQIVALVGDFQPWLFNPFSPFGAVVDTWARDPILPKHPLELLKENNVPSDVPWIVSHTTGEGLYNGYDYYTEENLDYIDQNWNKIMPHILHYNFTIDKSKQDQVSEKIRKEYFGTKKVDMSTFSDLIDVIGDRLFKVDLDTCTRLHSAAVKSSVWHYMFDYRGAHSFTDLRTGSTVDIGVSHGDDTTYVLKMDDIDTLSTEKDTTMSKIMVDMFLSFAKNGRPEVPNTQWPPASKTVSDPLKYLRINSPDSILIEEAEEFGNSAFWHSIPFAENEKLSLVKDEL